MNAIRSRPDLPRLCTVSTDEVDDFEEWARWFKCLADPTRLRILNHVAGLADPATVGDIAEELQLTQSNVSHHLKVLGRERFVLTEADGVRTLVRVNPTCMTGLPDAAAAIMRAGE